VNDKQILTAQQVEAEGLADWRMLFSTLHARYRTRDFATALRLVDRVGAEAEAADHHPDLDLTWGRLDVRLSSHDVGGVTARDVRLARRVTELAAEAGATADPAIDTADREAVKPFWRAVLALSDSRGGPDELVDPFGRLPTLWFQDTTPHEEPRQRFHVDVRVPPEEAFARVEAALAAGGTLVSDDRAPSFWVLADPDGNKACVTTWQGRG
jgi:4a-hydroxytetrahydrobiopterin dehydratase